MKKTILLSLLLSLFICNNSFANSFAIIHPLEFKETQKQEVLDYIKDNNYKALCKGVYKICDGISLRNAAISDLNAFKELMKANDKKLLDDIVDSNCNGLASSILMTCNYTTILRVYNNSVTIRNNPLEW
jgi:hypothetical protein